MFNINGIYYWRMKRRLSCAGLARAAGCDSQTVSHLEKEIEDSISYLVLLRLADALKVTLDELVADYPEDALGPEDRPMPKYTSSAPLNPVGNYWRTHYLSLSQMAQLLGKHSRQSASYVCIKPKLKPKDVLPLALMEGLTTEEFLEKYSTRKEHVA